MKKTLRRAAEAMLAAAVIFLLPLICCAAAPKTEAPKTEDKPITKTDIRAVALKLSKAGKQKELADIFAKFGCKKLSDFDSRTEDYPALMKELVSVNG